MNTAEQKVVDGLLEQLGQHPTHHHSAEPESKEWYPESDPKESKHGHDARHPEEIEIEQAEKKIREQLVETFNRGMGMLPEDPFEKIAKALSGIHAEIKSGFEWFKSTQNLATKQDLKEMEQRLIDSLGVDLVKVNQLTQKLHASTEALESSIKAQNQKG